LNIDDDEIEIGFNDGEFRKKAHDEYENTTEGTKLDLNGINIGEIRDIAKGQVEKSRKDYSTHEEDAGGEEYGIKVEDYDRDKIRNLVKASEAKKPKIDPKKFSIEY
jgi:hypothetical protein